MALPLRLYCCFAAIVLATMCFSLMSEASRVDWQPSLWPQPEYIQCDGMATALSLSYPLKIVAPNANPPILANIVSIYDQIIFGNSTCSEYAPHQQTTLPTDVVFINIGTDSEVLGIDTNESYTLRSNVSSSGHASIQIESATVFGARHALETLSQLVRCTEPQTVTVPQCFIKDEPRFAHRGMLVDTARYYFSPDFIKHIVDALSYNKFNVLHWHLTDAQSFPLQVDTFPQLAEQGAFPPNSFFCRKDKCNYTHDDVRSIVSYAKARGVRVVPEFDTPGHSYAWGLGYPNITVSECYAPILFNKDSIPMDPTNPFSLTAVNGVLTEAFGKQLFVDEFVHLGGDEVDFSCWESDSNISRYLLQHNMSASQLQSQFVSTVQSFAQSLNRTPINWDDVLQHGAQIPPTTVIDVWHTAESLFPTVNNHPYRAILSAGWYLNADTSWETYYMQEPFNSSFPWTDELKAKVLGGEVSKWGCSGFCPFPTTEDDFDPKVWPLACAVSERLWSSQDTNSTAKALPRLQAQTARLQRRGIGASPL